MNIKNKIKDLLLKSRNTHRKGSVTIEWMFAAPAGIALVIVSLMGLFICMSFVTYNNLANTIAQDLNMRSSGIVAAAAKAPVQPIIFKDYSPAANNPENKGKVSVNAGELLSETNIKTPAGEPTFRKAVLYTIDSRGRLFSSVPFSGTKAIRVYAEKNNKNAKIETALSNSSTAKGGATLAGTVIGVEIDWTFFNLVPGNSDGAGSGFVFTATGMNVIT